MPQIIVIELIFSMCFRRECMWQLWRNLKTPKQQKCSQSKPYTETSRKRPPPWATMTTFSDDSLRIFYCFKPPVSDHLTDGLTKQWSTSRQKLTKMNLFFGCHYCLHDYYCGFLVRSITTILTIITLKKKTQIFRFQFKKLRFCSSDVSGTFL